MKNVLLLTLLMLSLISFTQLPLVAGGENGIIPLITNKNATVGVADTVKVIMLDEYDWFGMYVSANDTLQADITVEYTATGTGKYTSYQDSVLFTTSAGGIKFITLRSPSVERIPFGADQMRVIISRRSYTQASVGKYSFGIQPYPYRRFWRKN